MSVATERAEGPILDVVLDGALLGVSAVYPSQRAGIWRFVREWTRELASRDDVRLHLVSSGRALWNELALEQTRSRDPFFSEVAHQWHPRPGTVPLWRRVQSAAADWAFRHASGASPTTLAGFLRALQPGLGQIPSLPNGSVYHSPYHALPGSRRIHGAKMRSITIHDMIPVLFPEWFENTDPFRNAVASIGPDDHVFADSANTRGDVVRLGAIAPDHVHVAYPGIGPGFRPHDRGWCRSELARLGIAPVRFLLAVGTLEPRKNLVALLEAFTRIARAPGREDLHLVMVGARGWKNGAYDLALKAMGDLRTRVVATGFVADTDLPILYGACEAFVYPSLYEGFGLPIAEAMACGAAVVCVDNSSQREVSGDVAELARDGTSHAVEAAIRQILSSAETLESRRLAGPDRAGRFTWKRCVDAHLDVWRCRA